MNRRELVGAAIGMALAGGVGCSTTNIAMAAARTPIPRTRVRPGDPSWPTAAQWNELSISVGGRLLQPVSPFAHCRSSNDADCEQVLTQLKNPYYIGDDAALTQSSGWVDAWRSQPSAYAVAAKNSQDVVAAVNFAREHNLRLVVKGGGHSYQGTSQAPDSLLIWTRHMNAVTVHDAFVGSGCDPEHPLPAVTVEAGAMWIDAYDAVTTGAGRYVQGGGCTTVGVAGLVQSGGFGSFSKNFGTAAASLIEAEIVTANGEMLVANACRHADLFWAIKGGGGGSFGVITKLTLRTHDLPDTFGGAFGIITADSDSAYRALIAQVIKFYRSALFNPHWGEQIIVRADNTLHISMVFQGLSQPQAEAVWQPLIAWVRSSGNCSFSQELKIVSLPARHFWDRTFLNEHAARLIATDTRPDASARHFLWAGDADQVGWFIHGYQSAWLSQGLLEEHRQPALVDALYQSSRQWTMSLHFNKGLAGSPDEAIAAARDTATHPQVLDAFALAICAADGPPAFDGMPGEGADLANARREAARVDAAMRALKSAAPYAGGYVSESNYFDDEWRHTFWGVNYRRLAQVKQTYDPDGLFYVRHGVGSDRWSDDGFTRV